MLKRISRTVVTSTSAIALLLFTTQRSYADGSGGLHHGWTGGWGGMMFGSSMMVIGTVLTIVLIVFAIRGIGVRSGPTEDESSTYSAHEILKDRFACGDIDEEEYEARKRALSN